MEIPISKFRSNLFALVDQAMGGAEVWVKHKGRRFRLVPENAPGDKLSRITPMQILVPGGPDLEDLDFKAKLLAEMQAEWEADWDRDFPLPVPKKIAPEQSAPRKRTGKR